MTNVTLTQLREALKTQQQELLDEYGKRQDAALVLQKDALLAEFAIKQDQLKAELLAEFTKKQEKWEADLSEVKQIADQNTNDIAMLKQTIVTLVDINKEQTKNIGDLTERVEERTNRQLRNTLVFKGIPDVEGEKDQGSKSWHITRQLLANKIAENIDGLDEEVAFKLLERVHRGKESKFNKGRRPIYAKLFDWNDCEKIKECFRFANMENRELNIYCEQMYGPRTRFRRNKAFIERKALKDDNKIVSGFVAYPAKLMVKYTRNKSEQYTQIKDFSKVEVIFESDT